MGLEAVLEHGLVTGRRERSAEGRRIKRTMRRAPLGEQRRQNYLLKYGDSEERSLKSNVRNLTDSIDFTPLQTSPAGFEPATSGLGTLLPSHTSFVVS